MLEKSIPQILRDAPHRLVGWPRSVIRGYLRTGYGLRRSTEIYRSKREKRFPTNTCRKLVLFLQKSPKVSGNLRGFTEECNL